MVKRILFVEGEHHLAQRSVEILSRFKPEWNFSLAYSGKEARMLMESKSVDAAVVDMSLRKGDWLDLLTALKMQNLKRPVMLISSESDRGTRLRVYSNGAFNFQEVPFSVQNILDNIQPREGRSHLSAEPENQTSRSGKPNGGAAICLAAPKGALVKRGSDFAI